MKHFSILLIALVFTIPVFGQKRGYYSNDSIISANIELIDMGKSNSYFCLVKKGNNVIKYTPYEVSKYGFNKGQVYTANSIVIDGQKERFFFEQIVKGNINLFYLSLKGGINKYYILPEDSSILREVRLNKVEIQELLRPFTDNCLQSAQSLKYLKPNKYSLKRYLNDLNSCSNYPFPKMQYGFKIGIAGTQFYPIDKSSNYSITDYKSDISFIVSAFIDIPIISSNISLVQEIYFKGNHYSQSFNTFQESFDLIMNYSSLNFPLMFKYRFLRDRNIPYIQLGPVYSRVLKNNSTLYKYKVIGNDIFIEMNDSPIIQKNMGGFSVGSGIIPESGKRYKWFGEVRYNYLFNFNSKQKNFNLGEFSINTGILF